MGQEAWCTVWTGRRRSAGTAYLGSDRLRFRGEFRLEIPFDRVRSVQTREGRLIVEFGDEMATFDLGARAERWARAIRAPKGLVDKLGVRPGTQAIVLGIADDGFLRELALRTEAQVGNRLRKGIDVIFLGADRPQALARLPRLAASLAPNGAIWVVAPRGDRRVREADVLAAGRAAGLVDVKVVRFSDTHTAHRFVIPRARRYA